MDIDPLVQLRMVQDRFIDGQAECALRRHLDSLGPDTPMADIVDSCHVWESHIEVASSRQMETMAVESLCPPVVAQTRPKGGCDPVLPRRMCRGRDVLTEDGPAAVDSGRESIGPDPDVCGGICVMPDCIPIVVPKSAAVPLAASVVAQTRPRGGCGSNLLLPVDRSIEPLDDDAPDVLISGREPAERVSGVGSDICVVPNQLPVVVSEETKVEDAEMEKFVLVPEACPVVSMMSTAELTFGPVLSEVYSPVVLAGGGGGVAAA